LKKTLNFNVFFQNPKNVTYYVFFALLHTFSRTMLLSEFPLQFCNGAGTQKKTIRMSLPHHQKVWRYKLMPVRLDTIPSLERRTTLLRELHVDAR